MTTWKCYICDADVTDYEPEYCCTYISIESPCGCMAKPLEPPLCSVGKAVGINLPGEVTK